MKVLLTDGSHKNTLAIVRYLGKEGFTIDILHHKKSAPAYSKYCNRLIICPEIQKEEEYYQFVLQLVKQQLYDILIPVGVIANKIFVRRIAEIRKYVKIEVTNDKAFTTAIEKDLTFKFAEKFGINHPITYYPENLNDARSLKESITFPVIIKSANESIIKFPTVYIASSKDLIPGLSKLEDSYGSTLNHCYPLIQERIIGNGFGFFAIYQDGVCKRVFMHERVRELPVSGGISTSARSYYERKLLEEGKRVLDNLNWHGPAMVEYKREQDTGEFKLIEINPKFWGSLELCLSAGMNFPLHLCDIASGKVLEYSEDYNRKRLFIWLVADNGELYRILQKPGDIFKMIIDLFRLNSRTDFWVSDFKPTALQIIYYIVWLKNKVFRKNR